ncbi:MULTISPECIES: cation:proton antiporter [unclassified Kitasatospora]|uniref:cation:proton antiporter n=1 Tax=unclassified Kitasatospora TaxID=2633591 RepID=UPI0033DA9D9A
MHGLEHDAAATEVMGLHLIFGALLFGLITPRSPAGSPEHDRLRETVDQSASLMMPAFFVLSGLAVDLRGLDWQRLLELILIVVTAVAGKMGGTYAAARLSRLPARSAAVLATLMNTRGLTELVLLSVGLHLGLLSQDLYSLMVVMALVTTAMTGPLLVLLERTEPPSQAWAGTEPRDERMRDSRPVRS